MKKTHKSIYDESITEEAFRIFSGAFLFIFIISGFGLYELCRFCEEKIEDWKMLVGMHE